MCHVLLTSPHSKILFSKYITCCNKPIIYKPLSEKKLVISLTNNIKVWTKIRGKNKIKGYPSNPYCSLTSMKCVRRKRSNQLVLEIKFRNMYVFERERIIKIGKKKRVIEKLKDSKAGHRKEGKLWWGSGSGLVKEIKVNSYQIDDALTNDDVAI